MLGKFYHVRGDEGKRGDMPLQDRLTLLGKWGYIVRISAGTEGRIKKMKEIDDN
jgi:hypothetical protein